MKSLSKILLLTLLINFINFDNLFVNINNKLSSISQTSTTSQELPTNSNQDEMYFINRSKELVLYVIDNGFDRLTNIISSLNYLNQSPDK